MRLLFCLCLLAWTLTAGGVKVGFNPNLPEVGPYPTNWLTLPDPTMKTGLKVSLPLPNCAERPSDCGELTLLNYTDGFNPQARITVKFSGLINVNTLRGSVYYLWLNPAFPREYTLAPAGTLTHINRVVWDPSTNTMYAKPDDILEQGRTYAIIVTDGVQDLGGDAVEPDAGFTLCRQKQIGGEYCEAVSSAASQAESLLPGKKVVGASVFTTLSATAFMESVKAFLPATPIVFQRGPVPVVNVGELKSVALRAQTKTSGPLQEIPFYASPAVLAQSGVAKLAFGSYRSPKFLTEQQIILPYPTAMQVGTADSEEIQFHAFLPATPMPANGYPVLLGMHGIFDNRFGMPSLMAATFAQAGWAVITINAVGHGYGPATRMKMESLAGATLDVPASGRGVDVDQNGEISTSDGCIIIAPGAPFAIRDCMRQTAIDYMQLIRAIRAGMDLDGDGKRDLDGDTIAMYAHSLGAFYGSAVLAIDPAVKSAVFNSGGASAAESSRGSVRLKQLIQFYLGTRQPMLLNLPGGDFDEQNALRYEPVKSLTIPGAAAIQEVMERIEWLEATGSPANFAPHFFSATLTGVPLKRALFQFAISDQFVVNPSESMFVRAANMREQTSIYRHDWMKQVIPDIKDDPHDYLSWLVEQPKGSAVSLAAFTQAATFIAAGQGLFVPNVNPIVKPIYGIDLFETPAQLPETLGFTAPRQP